MSLNYSRGAKFVIRSQDSFHNQGLVTLFLKVVAELIERRYVSKDDIEVQFINTIPDPQVVQSLGLQQTVVGSSSARFAEVDPQHSDVILYIQPGAVNGYLPDKFFKIISLNAKILALVPNPEHYAEAISDIDGVYLADIRDNQGIADALLDIYDQWRILKQSDVTFAHQPQVVVSDEWCSRNKRRFDKIKIPQPASKLLYSSKT